VEPGRPEGGGSVPQVQRLRRRRARLQKERSSTQQCAVSFWRRLVLRQIRLCEVNRRTLRLTWLGWAWLPSQSVLVERRWHSFVASDGREPLLLRFPSLQVEQVFFVMEGSVDSVLDLEYSYTLSTLEVSVFCFPNQTSPCCCGHISHSVLPCGARFGCRNTCPHTGWNAGSEYPLTFELATCVCLVQIAIPSTGFLSGHQTMLRFHARLHSAQKRCGRALLIAGQRSPSGCGWEYLAPSRYSVSTKCCTGRSSTSCRRTLLHPYAPIACRPPAPLQADRRSACRSGSHCEGHKPIHCRPLSASCGHAMPARSHPHSGRRCAFAQSRIGWLQVNWFRRRLKRLAHRIVDDLRISALERHRHVPCARAHAIDAVFQPRQHGWALLSFGVGGQDRLL
jgi:hypothetical protein